MLKFFLIVLVVGIIDLLAAIAIGKRLHRAAEEAIARGLNW
jgi:SNF family Na+-dependent transporter